MRISNILMEGENMQQNSEKLPEVIVFADPNGSGKSTITKMAKIIEQYINSDDIMWTNYYSDLEVAQIAKKREKMQLWIKEVLHLKQFCLQNVRCKCKHYARQVKGIPWGTWCFGV